MGVGKAEEHQLLKIGKAVCSGSFGVIDLQEELKKKYKSGSLGESIYKTGRTEEENKAASRRLREAASAGDVDGLRAAIGEGADVNSFQEGQERRGRPARCSLYLAASPNRGNSAECVRVLFDAGADVDLADVFGHYGHVIEAVAMTGKGFGFVVSFLISSRIISSMAISSQ